ncbi:hypothetical protein THRCLA_10726 [Thraustotheca clavata]|uniref:Uncharacterized protein n=1 Tax=Thraustotheca clavata TaxID=74557 RepID=A0A1V9YHR5_9STRA|nr:hypothetical protein THRCLA_10726 [Thraustotheca clavata]
MRSGLIAVENALGPFNAVDMKYVLCPQELLVLYSVFTSRLSALLVENPDAQVDFFALPPWPYIAPVPSLLMDNSDYVNLVGGNIMCGNDGPAYPPQYGMYRGFGVLNICHANFIESMTPTPEHLLFAFFGFNASHCLLSSDILYLCYLDANASDPCHI